VIGDEDIYAKPDYPDGIAFDPTAYLKDDESVFPAGSETLSPLDDSGSAHL
jgi:hypothetical protein